MEIDKFLESREAAPLTIKTYRQSLELFQRFLGDSEPSEEKVEEFLLKLHEDGLSPATINRHLSAIRTYFKWLKKKAPKEKRPNFDLVIQGPKVHRKLPPLRTGSEIKSVIDLTENAFERALVLTIYEAALRIDECMNLQIENIDYAAGYIKIIGKGGEEYRLPVSNTTLEALKKYIGKRRGKVFTQPYWRLRYEIRKMGTRAGIKKLTPHQLRHARATDLRSRGVPIEVIQEFLRHKQIQTTLIYARAMPTELKEKIPAAV